MGRIRSVKPEFWCSEQIAELSPIARLLFIGMWNFCDDAGVHPASAKTLKMEVFPGDDITSDEVTSLVQSMIDMQLVAEFTGPDQKKYWFVTGWSRHQKTDRPSYKYPKPPAIAEQSPSNRRAIAEQSPTESIGEYSVGKERNGEGVTRAHEEENFLPHSPELPSPSEPSAYETTLSAILTWGAAEDWGTLKKIAQKANFIGNVNEQVARFITHHLSKPTRAQMLSDPVKFLREQLPGWLLLPAAKNGAPKQKQALPSAKIAESESFHLSLNSVTEIAKTNAPDVAHLFTPTHFTAMRRKASTKTATELALIIATGLRNSANPNAHEINIL